MSEWNMYDTLPEGKHHFLIPGTLINTDSSHSLFIHFTHPYEHDYSYNDNNRLCRHMVAGRPGGLVVPLERHC